jgi:starch phosphorylase
VHGYVSSRLVADHWPEIRPDENPVGFVTNGVHVPTFLHQSWSAFFDEMLDDDWRERLSEADFWRKLEQIPDEQYWAAACAVKSRMLAGVRERLRRAYARKGLSPAQWRHVTRLLDPEQPNTLTIGFARRFATYKRAALLLRDRARLARILNDPQRPVLFLFAGKAHPADEPGKQVLREIKQLMMIPEFMGRVVFLEDYDMQLARWLVSGVDVWLNNPIAPLEASGTSGMKAAVNGRLNLSVLDGWWAEGWSFDNGWGIPPANVQDPERRDALDAELVFDTIEEEVVPLYYARNDHGYSPEWVRRSKRAMMTVIPQFNMRRVLQDYAEGLYYPAARQHHRLAEHEFAGARWLAEWKQRVRQAWPKVDLRLLSDAPRELPRSDSLRVRVAASLAGLQPTDVRVEFVARRRLPEGNFEPPALSSYRRDWHEGLWSAPLNATGEVEWHELLSHPYELGLMKWL